MKQAQILLFIVQLYMTKLGQCERLHEQIYSSIEGGAACFRRLNGTHQTGCSSPLNGAVGIVSMIKNVTDAQWLVANASVGPYMAVVSTSLFHAVVEIFMASPKNIAGVLIFDNATARSDLFTQESRCPNEYSSGPGSQCTSSQPGSIAWNEGGTGLLRRNIPFPMFYLPKSRNEEIAKIEQCHNSFNLDKNNHQDMPLCSVQMHSFMFAAVDTAVCMRRSAETVLYKPTKVCDPLGDHNVYYTLFPRAKESSTTKKSVTLVTARIDSASLFDGVAPGAASSVVGMVTLITAAATLAKMIPVTDVDKYNHNILWTLFNGEAFDYIGSQRVAYDLKRGTWPHTFLNVSDILLHVELGQLGGALANKDGGWPLHAFVPYTSDIPAKVTEFLAEISDYAGVYNLNITPEFNTNLPPSSLHSFRNVLQTETVGGALPELLLVDHKETFTNMFYHSVLDDYESVDFMYRNISIGINGTFLDTDEMINDGILKVSDIQVKLARLATALTRTLYQQVTGSPYVENISASAHLVDEMLFCFLQSQACRLLMYADYAASNSDVVLERAVPLYVGVVAWASPPAVFAGHLLALLTGAAVDSTRKGCDARTDPNYSHYWLRGWDLKGVCIQTTMNFSQAISPAFVAQDYDLKSGTYSTWTESVWMTMWLRVFVAASGAGARAAAIAGAITTILSALVTYWMSKHASVLFVNAPATVLGEQATGILRTVNC